MNRPVFLISLGVGLAGKVFKTVRYISHPHGCLFKFFLHKFGQFFLAETFGIGTCIRINVGMRIMSLFKLLNQF